MPEPGMTAASALGGTAGFNRSWKGCSVSEVPGRAVASIAAGRGRTGVLRTAAASAFGFALPEAGRWVQTDTFICSWAGQGKWLVEAFVDGQALLDTLNRTVGDSAAVADLSDAWVRLDLAGPRAPAVLEKLCPLDLHPSVFPVGSVTQTLMDHLGVWIALMDHGPRFSLRVDRSAARSFLHTLVQAADSACGPGQTVTGPAGNAVR